MLVCPLVCPSLYPVRTPSSKTKPRRKKKHNLCERSQGQEYKRCANFQLKISKVRRTDGRRLCRHWADTFSSFEYFRVAQCWTVYRSIGTGRTDWWSSQIQRRQWYRVSRAWNNDTKTRPSWRALLASSRDVEMTSSLNCTSTKHSRNQPTVNSHAVMHSWQTTTTCS